MLQMETVMHGRETPIHIVTPEEPLFAGLSSTVQVGRYHSWLVRRDDLPDCFTVTAEDDSNAIMGISHNSLDVRGVQFHPESVMTSTGEQMLRNWLSL